MNTINIPKASTQPKPENSQHIRNSRLTLNIPSSFHDVQDNYFVQALAQTTLEFCRETTLHGIKQVVVDIQELGSSYSRSNDD